MKVLTRQFRNAFLGFAKTEISLLEHTAQPLRGVTKMT